MSVIMVLYSRPRASVLFSAANLSLMGFHEEVRILCS